MTHHAESRSHQPFSDTLYASLCRIAGRALRGSSAEEAIQPAELVHECYLKLSKSRAEGPRDPVEFRALAATMIRQALVDRVRYERSLKRGEGWSRITLQEGLLEPSGSSDLDLLALDEALERLAVLDPRQARIVELRYFGGLTIPEVARSIGVAPRTVDGDWKVARAWLRRALS